ncbi:EamA family transporter [Alicyclobacillus sp. ALC3]|uniref:EamA family transporter n=1 Tax=Alicyclobacillus sp. ALC3 TaxID=2796143 RepID=UPI0023798666|nr:EamA family transporter [Alicyclobacillus sp. ALC3]WDL96149.1 EamA family transporter [Alicyclobacillus sp. ALC3]
MDFDFIMLGLLMFIRVLSLSTEQLSVHGLGREVRQPLATMVITFGGAACVLWGAAALHDQVEWIGITIWSGAIYAITFGLYTTALGIGPVGEVSPWTNATIVLMWLVRPTGGIVSALAMVLFAVGAWKLVGRKVSKAVVMMVAGDVLLVTARLVDASHTGYPLYAYAASQFTSVALWMLVPTFLFQKHKNVLQLAAARPLWGVTAAGANAIAYLTLFALLKWLPPTIVEAVSSLAGLLATLFGVVFFRETDGRRKIVACTLMTLGVLCLLLDHWHPS